MNDQRKPDEYQSPFGCILHTLWLFGGSATLFFCIVHVAVNRKTHLSIADAVFAAAMAGAIGLRYVEIQFFNGTTDDGQPATLADLRRYALRLLLIAGAALGIAHLLAAFL